MMSNTGQKYDELKKTIKEYGKALVCYSGGVDSTLLLKASVDALGRENVIALIAKSATYLDREVAEAKEFAEACGVACEVVETDEMEDEDFLLNSKERCYYCKTHLFKIARNIAKERGVDYIFEGSNVDDQGDYRPGRRAGKELGVKSPLLYAGLNKQQIREVSKELNLPTHDKPSLACLASRIPYGTRIDNDVLKKIERSEEYLRSLGVGQLRVRYHGQVARIEISDEDLDKVITFRDEIGETLKQIGFLYVTLDLKGYRTGSMNEGLAGRSDLSDAEGLL
jgi:pyridinium-3,5-biscarboxylic acid mononucleotide sulfurtransferase